LPLILFLQLFERERLGIDGTAFYRLDAPPVSHPTNSIKTLKGSQSIGPSQGKLPICLAISLSINGLPSERTLHSCYAGSPTPVVLTQQSQTYCIYCNKRWWADGMDKTWPELNNVVSMDLNNWDFRNSSHDAASLIKSKYKNNNHNLVRSVDESYNGLPKTGLD